MNFHATIRLTGHGLEFRCPAANVSEDRPITFADWRVLAEWSVRHQKLARERDPAAGLLKLGTEIFEWLNGSDQFLKRLTNTVQAPLLIQFATDKDDSRRAPCFLDAPWELLAHDGRHWVLRADTVFCPVRVIGDSVKPPPPSPARLSLVFMAAAPRGADNLNYEAEEASILTATRNVGLDLVVEESGELGLLSACVAREKPDVVQISCHGTLTPEPGLLLEDEVGGPAFVRASALVSKLASHHPRLLFLSACETAEAHALLDSLARTLVRSGAPAVLGWAAPVLDTEATLFAAHVYTRLAAGEDLAHAVAWARLDLRQSEELRPEQSRDWHLARLYLGSSGGGALATAGGPRRLVGRGRAIKTFLDTVGKQVPVANELEFVGRRRQIQKILREFRAPETERHAGVLIHGMGRQGKSSLAARLAHRLEHTHDVIVLFGRYDAASILAAFRDRLATLAVNDIVNRHLPDAKKNLLPALTELLQGPCQQPRKDADGRVIARPVLLVIDDFEQALEERASGPHLLKADFVEPILAVIRAFQTANTESRLLFTSRFQFTLPDGTSDVAKHLLDVPLPGMDPHEARKQAAARYRRGKNAHTLEGRSDDIMAAAHGNPGLQDLLFSLCLEDAAACDRSLAQMQEFHSSGKTPQEDKVRQFLENLAVGALMKLLTLKQRELLRAATVFDLPAPLPVMQRLAGYGAYADGEEGIARLVALGLWEVYEDLHQPLEPALAINTLVHPLAGALSDPERQELAGAVTAELFARWGGETGGRQRSHRQNHQLTELALLAREPQVLAATGAVTLRYLDQRFEYRQAAVWGKQIVAVFDDAGCQAPVDLLRTAAERCHQVGEVREAGVFLGRALAEIARLRKAGVPVDPQDHSATLLAHGRALVRQGRPDEALQFLEQAMALAVNDLDRAVMLGDVARLRADKGDVDAALSLHKERIAVFEALGDIARLRANKGEVDAALSLYLEELGVHESLGDIRSRAIVLGDIARLRADRGEVDAALSLNLEELGVYEALGDTRQRALTLSDIARLRADKGEVDAALALHQEALSVYEALGDTREHAVTLGDIARLRAGKGEVDAALALHKERMGIFEALGDARERAVTLGDIAGLRAGKGEVDAALALLKESMSISEALGDQAGIANTLWSLARIELGRRKFQEAFEYLSQSYEIFLKLGRLDGICSVGIALGQLLCRPGQVDEGRVVLTRSRDGFAQLGRGDMVEFAQSLLDRCPGARS